MSVYVCVARLIFDEDQAKVRLILQRVRIVLQEVYYYDRSNTR